MISLKKLHVKTFESNMVCEAHIWFELVKSSFFLPFPASCELCSTVNFCRNMWQSQVFTALQHKLTKFSKNLLMFLQDPRISRALTFCLITFIYILMFLQTQRNWFNRSLWIAIGDCSWRLCVGSSVSWAVRYCKLCKWICCICSSN